MKRTALFCNRQVVGLMAALLLVLAGPVAANIIQESGDANTGLNGGRKGFAQSFTADSSVASLHEFQWYYYAVNASKTAASPSVTLYDGDGIAGSVIQSVPTSLAEGEPTGWKSVDFAGISLTPGNIYTFEVLVTVDSEGAYRWQQNVNPYAGGILYRTDNVFLANPTPSADAMFRVIGVPEPTTMALLAVGAVGLIIIRSRRNR